MEARKRNNANLSARRYRTCQRSRCNILRELGIIFIIVLEFNNNGGVFFFRSSKATIYPRPPDNDILNKRMIYRYVRYAAATAGGRQKGRRGEILFAFLFHVDDETELEFRPQYAIFHPDGGRFSRYIGNNNEVSRKSINSNTVLW